MKQPVVLSSSLGPAGPRRSVGSGLVPITHWSLNNKCLARGYRALGTVLIREMRWCPGQTKSLPPQSLHPRNAGKAFLEC